MFPVVQNLDADFVIVQIHKPAGRICPAEFPFKKFRIPLSHAKSDN
jgi:hypothetical protein